MKCPFCKDYRDIKDIFHCHAVPDEPCRTQKFPTLDLLRSHADSKGDVYHRILWYYLGRFNEEYERSVLFPKKWLPSRKLISSKTYFKTKGDYYDIKTKSKDHTIIYCLRATDYCPFGQPKYIPETKSHSHVVSASHATCVMRVLHNFGFESTLECPFHYEYLSKMKIMPMNPKMFQNCHECDNRQYPNLQSLIDHALSIPSCQYHKCLAHYLKLFRTFYVKYIAELDNPKPKPNK